VPINGKPLLNGKYDGLSTPLWPDYVKLIHDGKDYKLNVAGKILSFGKEYAFGGGNMSQSIDPSLLGTCPANSVWDVGEVSGRYRR